MTKHKIAASVPRTDKALGRFSAPERKKLKQVLCSEGDSDRWCDRIIEQCAWIAMQSAPGGIDYNHRQRFVEEQRQQHRAATKIRKYARSILYAAEGAGLEDWVHGNVQQVLKLMEPFILRGKPARGMGTSPFFGAEVIANWYLLESGRKRLPMSRSGPFAEVLRIVYRLEDPLPLVRLLVGRSGNDEPSSIETDERIALMRDGQVKPSPIPHVHPMSWKKSPKK